MRALERVVLAAILAAGGAAPSAAQGPTTYDACYVPGVGAVYLIKQPGLPAACLAPTHIPISWTTGELADGSVTEVKLAFDPSTQAELDAFAAALAAAGVINTAENPVDWTQLKNVPADFADGVDNTGGTPTDLVCPGCVETTDLADAAVTAAKLADGGVTEVKLAFDPSTQAELDAFVAALAAAGVINTAENPVDWTQLKNVPADFADGVDDAGGGVTDHGALTGLVDDDHPQYLLAGVRDALNGFAVTGNYGLGTIPATGEGTRLMWYPAKAAFRAGHALTQWDDANVGAYSTAMGASPTASALWSTAIGVNATASGSAAVAMGFNTTASGGSSVAMGNVTTASGTSAVAIGNGATASGGGATALGGSTSASGNNSTAMGLGATASGALSTAIGHVTTAQAYGSLAIGRVNVVAGNQTQWLETDPLFVAGNGASDAARSNALTLYKNGNLDLAGTLTAAAFVGDGSGLTNLPGGTSSDLVCAGCVETTDLADAAVSEAKLAFDPSTQAELDAFVAALAAAGVINTAGNPVDWTQLKNVPADFADGVDDVSGGVTDHGALAGLADDDHPQYLLAGVRDAPDGFAVTGPINTSGTLPVSGAGARLMWYPRNASFRAGSVTGTQWDTPGAQSAAFGWNTTASGNYSLAAGGSTTASGPFSTALGQNTVASGSFATALGNGSTASDQAASAVGFYTNASAQGATALGWSTTASGQYATALGVSTTASGARSTAMGGGATASGDWATAAGNNTTAQAQASFAIGRYNVVAGDATQWLATDPLFVAGNGTADAARSNALTLYKNGNLDLAGTLTAAAFVGDGSGLTNLPGVTDHGGLTGLGDDDHPQYLLAGVRDATDGFAVTGTPNTGTISATGAGTRLMWYPGKSAFRAGTVSGAQWDAANVGQGSVAIGTNTTASGTISSALGGNTTASGHSSTAMGNGTTASGSYATAMGWGTMAQGGYATSMGMQSAAIGDRSTAMGDLTGATGYAATSMGSNTVASGTAAVAMGAQTAASGETSTAMGSFTAATGLSSAAMGTSTTAQAFASLVIGRGNVLAGDPLQWLGTDPLFVAGNGTPAAPSNALTLYKNGNLDLAGTLTAAAFVGDGSGLTNLPGVADHGGLTGLGDDDHPQYLLAGVRDATDGFAVTGTLGTGTFPASGAGVRLMWYPAKGAFRAGHVDGTQWDDAVVGLYSTALGHNTNASGIGATAMGWASNATGQDATAMGASTTASGLAATAMGNVTSATGSFSTAMGASTTASGNFSTATGYATTASGHHSTTLGEFSNAMARSSVAIGRFNVVAGDATQWLDTDPLFVAGNGTSDAARSNALTLYKNGNLDLAGTLTAAAFVGDGSGLTNLPTGVTDHGGLTGLADDDHPQYLLAGVRDAPDGFAVTGTFGTGTIPTSGTGTRLMWYPGKAAFRAGYAFGTNWDTGNIGDYSAATGYNNIASGTYSVAAGINSTASATGAIALGTTVVASGAAAVSLGVGTTASNANSTAMGNLTSASGYVSTAFGGQTTASNNYSTAMGFRSTASGAGSTVIGEEATAQARTSLVIGRYNVVAGDQIQWFATDPLLVAGNGADDANRSNALTLLKNGNLTIAGTLTENSDVRLKQDIEPLGDALTRVLNLTPIRYRFRPGTGHPAARQIGLSAQDVRTAFPELVSEDSQGYLSVAYANLTAVLVRAVQEQQAEIDALKAEVAALRAARTKEAGER